MDDYVKANFEVHQGYPRVWGAVGEPNYLFSWRVGIDALVNYSDHFYKLCKRLDPDTLVIGPNAGSWNVPFVKSFPKAGGAKTIDGVDIHFNTMAGDMENMQFAERLRDLKVIMRKYGGEKPIWITEFGVNCRLPYTITDEFMWLFRF